MIWTAPAPFKRGGLFVCALTTGIFQTQPHAAAEDFCEALKQIVVNVPTDFKNITKSDGKATLSLPGAICEVVDPEDPAFDCKFINRADRAKAETVLATVSDKVAACYPDAKRTNGKTPNNLNESKFRLVGSKVIFDLYVGVVFDHEHYVSLNIFELQ